MNKSKAYRSIPVKCVDPEKVLSSHLGEMVEAGLDIGKQWIWVVIRFRDGTYLRPWRASNPLEVVLLSALLKRIGQLVKLTVGMESSGTYGDPLRQAMKDAGVPVHRVSSKRQGFALRRRRTTGPRRLMAFLPNMMGRTQGWWPSCAPWARACLGD